MSRAWTTPEVFALLAECSWPGNVRELRNTVERMAMLSPGDQITADAVPIEIRLQREAPLRSNLREARESAERDHIIRRWALRVTVSGRSGRVH
jgi:DNA-binding NtrC family response regulator